MRESAERAGSSTCSTRPRLCPAFHLHIWIYGLTASHVSTSTERQLALPETSEGKKTESKMIFLGRGNYAHLQCKCLSNHPGALSADRCNSCPCLCFHTTHLPASAFKALTFHCSTSSSCFQKGSDFLDVHRVPFHLSPVSKNHPTDENYTGCSAAG